jgi:DNA-binding NarL/FixJ family response regulator
MITVEQAKMLGLRAFIMKPILKEELAVVIRDVLDGGE